MIERLCVGLGLAFASCFLLFCDGMTGLVDCHFSSGLGRSGIGTGRDETGMTKYVWDGFGIV
jgi:hypothetical protein